MNTKNWLAENGYEDIVRLIIDVEAEWNANGSKTRRDWWHVLAGSDAGTPTLVAGREFPVLWAARKRKGLPNAKNALKRNNREVPPPVRRTGRWPK